MIELKNRVKLFNSYKINRFMTPMKLLLIIPLIFVNCLVLYSQQEPTIHQPGTCGYCLSSISISVYRNSVYISTYEGIIYEVDMNTGNLKNIIQKDVSSFEEWDFLHKIYFIDISPDSKYMCASNLEIWDLNSDTVITQLEGYGNIFIKNIEFSQSGKFVAGIGDLTSSDQIIYIWHVESGKLVYKIERKYTINNFKFGKDDNTIFFFEQDNADLSCKKFDLNKNSIIAKYDFSTWTDGLINVSINEKYIVEYNSLDNSIISTDNKKEILKLKRNWPSEIIFSDDENYIVYFDIINQMTSVVIMDIKNKSIYIIIPISFFVNNLVLSEDSKNLIMRNQSIAEMINLENKVLF